MLFRSEGKIQLFRPEMNARRMIKSNERLCMPGVPEEMFVEAVKALVKAQEDWVPSEPGTSLYIRPFMFATEASLGVHMAKSYKFVIITTPVGAYYAEGINPVKILVEDEYVRAVKGGGVVINVTMDVLLIGVRGSAFTKHRRGH